MLSRLRYATFANYSPRGRSALSVKSRLFRDAFKAGSVKIIDRAIARFNPGEADPILPFLHGDRTLIPIPGSAVTDPTVARPPMMICERLLAHGFGFEIADVLRRVTRVPKSAFAAPGQRATATLHYDTVRVRGAGLFEPERITLVDDVLTLGSTAMGCAWRLQEEFPNAEIVVFAMLRTQGLQPDVTEIKDPSAGEIAYFSETDRTDRDPL